jgi:riboflavin kinase/FMN adenylyltransferase
VITIENVHDFPAHLRGAYVTIGNFDGVHRGHARLISELVDRARAVGAPALAVTFHPHPATFLRPDRVPEPLVWLEREIQLLEAAGLSDVAVFKTGPWLLELPAREFFERVVMEQFGVRGMVEGPNFFFGHNRGGDVRVLAEWCDQAGIDLHVAEPLTTDDGRMISSSRIRATLAEGDVAEARELLGRPHRIRGVVSHGAGRGAGIGVPTANLHGVDVLIPADGVYAARVHVPGADGAPPTPWPAACNIGPNPTFGEQTRKVEAHLIGFRGDLYGRMLEMDFLQRLRPTRAFAGLDELLDQIGRDVEEARLICEAG